MSSDMLIIRFFIALNYTKQDIGGEVEAVQGLVAIVSYRGTLAMAWMHAQGMYWWY